jgi:hypothetical protein
MRSPAVAMNKQKSGGLLNPPLDKRFDFAEPEENEAIAVRWSRTPCTQL